MDIIDLFKTAVAKNASDIIVTTPAAPILRINGELIAVKAPIFTADDTKKLIYGILSEEQVVKFEAHKELDFSFTLEEKHRFRCNVFYQKGSVGANFRLIHNKIPSLAELNLPLILEDFALQPHGLILVTGPTGHGKSTTQAAMIDLINIKRKNHVITIEDPIEYIHQNKQSIIEQREVGDDTLSFADALKHVFRQNPDIILVGEMRDPESIASALTAAETGHLVISTLHTSDAVQAIDRLIDVFPPYQQGQIRAQLSLSLCAIISQRLIPRADKKGLIVAVEILKHNSAVANLIRDAKIHQLYTIMETHAKEGMKTMDYALKELYLQGLITYEDCRRRMRSPAFLDKS